MLRAYVGRVGKGCVGKLVGQVGLIRMGKWAGLGRAKQVSGLVRPGWAVRLIGPIGSVRSVWVSGLVRSARAVRIREPVGLGQAMHVNGGVRSCWAMHVCALGQARSYRGRLGVIGDGRFCAYSVGYKKEEGLLGSCGSGPTVLVSGRVGLGPSCAVQASWSDWGCEQLVLMHPKGNARDGGPSRVELGCGTVGSSRAVKWDGLG